jgi:GNAT superfamily N-acetyltransferase
MFIRQAAADDIPALDAIALAQNSRKASDYFAQCLEEQAAGRRLVFVAGQGNAAPAGYGMLNFHPQYALYKRLGIPEIQDLNVMPDARKQGLATAIINRCELIALERGCEHIGISVGLYADYGPAQRLYVRLGYVPDGYGVTYDRQPVRPGEMRPVDDDLCLMMVKSFM